MQKSIKAILVASLLFSAFSAEHLLAQDGDPIGRILVTKGSVQAQTAAGQTRTLRRGAELFEADSVVTGPNGFAQIRMIDGAQIALKEDTEFAFNQYAFDGNPATGDNAAMELLRGGFRTISGSIGDSQNDDYVVETPFASIGVRGTTHEAVIDFNSLFTGVYDGGTTVSNEFGSVDTGLGGNFDYSQTSQGQSPRGLLRQPGQLGRINLNPGVVADGDDGTGDDGTDDGTAGGDGGDGGDGAGDGNGGDDGAAAGGGNDGNNDDDAPDFNVLGATDTTGGNQGGGTTPPPVTPPTGGNTGVGAGNDGGNTGTPPAGTNTNTDQAINPTQNIRDTNDIENPGSAITDADGDGIDDSIDPDFVDSDGDGIVDALDPDLIDSDGDGIVDALDPDLIDSDGDGIVDAEDPDLIDSDGDGIVDAEDPDFIDSDGDGVVDSEDPDLIDSDGDGIVDAQDPDLIDSDGDGIVDAEDPDTLDTDGDGIPDSVDPDQLDSDGDGIVDSEDPDLIDSDGDGIVDAQDPDLVDSDGDGIVDALDPDLVDSDGDGVVDSEDVFPNDPTRTAITPVLNTAQVNAILDGGRQGFTLSGSYPVTIDGVIYPAILFGDSNDASSGFPILIIDDIDADGLPFMDDATFAILKTSGSVASSALGFTNGISSFNSQVDFDVQWGLWGPAQGLRSFTNLDDDSVSTPINTNLLWANTLPSDLTGITTATNYWGTDLSGQVNYWGAEDFIGGSTAGAMNELFANFEINFGTGAVTNGWMEFCLGGSGDCDYNNGAQEWELEFSGQITDGKMLANPIGARFINDAPADIEGVIDGLFTNGFIEGLSTESPDGFLGGLSLIGAPSGQALTYVDAVFLLEREERFTNTELQTLINNQDNSFFVQPGYARNFLGHSRPTLGSASNILLIVDDEEVVGGIDYSRNVFKNGSSTLIDRIDAELDTIFDVTWERWQGPLELFTNNFDATSVIDESLDGISPDIAYVVNFDESYLGGIRGTFDNVLAFIGEDEQGTLLTSSDLSMSFDVDFMKATENISNGLLNLDFYENGGIREAWDVSFIGNIVGNDIVISITDGSMGKQPDPWVYSDPADFEGDIQGAFVDNSYGVTPASDVAFVTSFYLKDTSVDTMFSGNFVTGVGLIGGSVENRFDAFAQSDMTRLGFLAPVGTDNQVYSALATTASGTPIFADNTASIPTDPFQLPVSENINYVFLNQGAGVQQYPNVGGYDITLGAWQPGSAGKVAKLTDSLNLDIGTDYFDDVYWSSVGGGGPLDSAYVISSLTYGHSIFDDSFMGETSAGIIKGVKAHFDATYLVDSVTSGVLSICAGGSQTGCSDESTLYFLNFSGSLENGTFTADSITSMIIKMPDGSVVESTISGELEGLFTGKVIEGSSDLYDAFVGGFNFSDAGSNHFITGNFVVEREDRLTSSQINNASKNALMVDTDTGLANFYRATTTLDNSLTFISRSESLDDVIKFDSDASGDTIITTETSKTTNPGGFDLTWATWTNAEVLPDNLILGNFDSRFNSAPPLWWAVYDDVIPPSNLTGTYRTILTGEVQLPFIGAEGDLGDLGGSFVSFTNSASILDIEFDVNLTTGDILNGMFSASVETGANQYNTWVLNGFNGAIKDGDLNFNFIDAGTNDFGDYTPYAGTATTIDHAQMNGSFVTKSTVPNFEGEGVVGGFAFDASDGESGGSYLDGLFVAGVEDVVFLDKRLEGLDPLETDEYDPVNNGLVMIGDWSGWSSGYSPVYSGIVAFDAASPVFLTDWDGIPYTVFKQDNATGVNTFPLSSTYPGVQWGIWDMQAGEIGPSAYYDVAAESFDNFDFLPWLVVPALDPSTEITTYTGSTNYGFTRDSMTRNNWEGTLSALNVSMDVDFTYGSIYDGTINLCFGGTGCASSDESWHGHFGGGSINQGVINPMWVYGSVSNGWDFEGEIGGFLTGYNAGAAYDAIVGGFSFAEGNCGEGCSSYTGRTVSGTFLSEQELRLDAYDMDVVDGWKRAALMTGDGTVHTGLMGLHNTRSLSSPSPASPNIFDIFFIDEGTTNHTIWKLGDDEAPEHILWNQYVTTCENLCILDFGVWDGSATVLTDNTNASIYTMASGPIAWLNYEPVDFDGVSLTRLGQEYFYGPQSFKAQDSSFEDIAGTYIDEFYFDYDVDFSTNVVHNGKLVFKRQEVIEDKTLDFVWTLAFAPNNGIVDGVNFFDENDFSSAILEVWDGSTLVDTVAVSNIIISGAYSFDPTDATNEAEVIGNMILETTFTAPINSVSTIIDTRIAGEYDIWGYRETRLTRDELLNMNDYLGLLVKRTSGLVDEHFFTNGNNSDMIFADNNITDTQMGTDADLFINDRLHGYDPVQLVVENGGLTAASTLDSSVSSQFSVGWGAWNGGANIIDAQGGSSAFHSEPLYWLSAKRADIQDLNGEWNYNTVLAAEGEGTHGSLSSLDMSFDVSFGTGLITGGQFEAVVGGSDTRWYTEFTGTAHGPVANINDFSGATLGLDADYSLNAAASITGEMRGIFTEGTAGAQGFATGFALEATTDGGSTFSNLNGVGILGTRTALGVP